MNCRPERRTVSGEEHRYALGAEYVDVTFGVDYVAKSSVTVSIRLEKVPTIVQPVMSEPVDWTAESWPSILVYPVDSSNWTTSRIMVACNLGKTAADGDGPNTFQVKAKLKVF